MKKWFNLLVLVLVFQASIYLFLDRFLFLPAADFSQQLVSEGNQLALDPDKLTTDQKYLAQINSDGIVFVTADKKTVQEVALQETESVSYFAWVPDTHLALIGITTNGAKTATVTLKCVNLDTNAQPVEPEITGLALGSKIEAVAFSPQVNVTYMLITNNTSKMVYRTDANNKLTKVLTNANITRIACLQSVDTVLMYNQAEKTIYARSIKGTSKLAVPKSGKYVLIGADKDDYIYIGQLSNSGLVTSVLRGTSKGNFTDLETLISPCQPSAVKVNYYGELKLQ